MHALLIHREQASYIDIVARYIWHMLCFNKFLRSRTYITHFWLRSCIKCWITYFWLCDWFERSYAHKTDFFSFRTCKGMEAKSSYLDTLA